MFLKEAEAELGGADSCSQPVTFYIGRARKFFAPDFVKWNMMIMMIVTIVMIMAIGLSTEFMMIVITMLIEATQ